MIQCACDVCGAIKKEIYKTISIDINGYDYELMREFHIPNSSFYEQIDLCKSCYNTLNSILKGIKTDQFGTVTIGDYLKELIRLEKGKKNG